MASTPFSMKLDPVGDGTGDPSARVNGDPVGVVYRIIADEESFTLIYSMSIYIQDGGILRPDRYGTDLTLTNGIRVELDINGNVRDLLNGSTVTTNGGWQALSGGIAPDPSQTGPGDKSVVYEWKFSAGGLPHVLPPADSGVEFRVVIQDDLTELSEHLFVANGRLDQHPPHLSHFSGLG